MTARSARLALSALLLLLMPPGCGRAQGAVARNLLLISIDTLRPDMLGCYGHELPTSPTLDDLARTGTLFEDVTATAPWTLPSHASLLTGVYPNRHGLVSPDRRLPDALGTLAEAARAAGMRTAAIVNSQNVGERYGLDRGFEAFQRIPEDAARRAPTEVEARALDWIGAHDGAPFFLFLHFYDVHSDYVSLPEYERRFVGTAGGALDGSTGQLRAVRTGELAVGQADARHLAALYQAGVRQMDDGIGRVLAALEQRGILVDTLVVVVSDHGEEFLEHGGVLHGRTHHQELLRVPWIVSGPGVPAGTRVAQPVSLVDVMPTCLALLGQAPPADLDGQDVSAHLRPGATPAATDARTLYASADHHNDAGDDLLRTARRGRYKLTLDRRTGSEMLYDLQADPGETADAAAGHAELTAALRAQLLDYDERAVAGEALPPLTPEERERMAELGY
jgi:arylsulfatase A-like enzyme